MRFKTLYIILSLLLVFKMEAQNLKHNFRLEADLKSTTGKLYLGQYWRGLSYAIDSTTILQGKATFNLNQQLDPGEYFLYSKSGLLINLLIDKEQKNIQVSINESDISKSKITGNEDSRLLWKYQYFSQKIEALQKLAEQKDDDKARVEIAQIKDSLNQLLEKNTGTWFAAFTKGRIPISLPYPEPKNVNEFYANKDYGRDHYFDNIDLTDPRMWRTNYLISTIDLYMSDWIDNIPDTLATAASSIVAKTKGNDTCFKEMLSYMVNTSLNSKRMGDENIWAKLYEDYIADKEDISWITPAERNSLKSKYESIKNNRIGMIAHNLTLQTIDEKKINTGDIDADYLILYFYDNRCHHCLEDMPKTHDLSNKYKDKGVKVVTVDISGDKKEATNFINKLNLNDWTNCIDPEYKSQYWLYYNTSGIPSVYIMDRDKRIIAKDLNSENIKQVLEFYIK